MGKRELFIFLFFSVTYTTRFFSQTTPIYKAFKHFQIKIENDTVNYDIYSNKKLDQVRKIIFFAQGSGPSPMFLTKMFNNVEKVKSNIPFEMDKIPNDYALVLISKKCVPFVAKFDEYQPKKCYFENESLDYRVWQNKVVMNEVVQMISPKPDVIIGLGHSEGSNVIAKLGVNNKHLTHIGFFAGSGTIQYYDFALFIQKEFDEGKINDETASIKLNNLFNQIADINANPNSIEKYWLGNTYKRWFNFSESSVDNLLKIDIPIFVAVGAKDESVSAESSLLIPINFLKKGKNNLTYKIYPYYDHSFNKLSNNEKESAKSEWMSVFTEFLNWSEKK